MTNLVSRLRDWKGNDFGPYRSPVPDLLEAADEIERLERALWLAYEKSRNDDEQIRDYAARLSAEPTTFGPFCMNHEGYSGMSENCPACRAQRTGESQ